MRYKFYFEKKITSFHFRVSFLYIEFLVFYKTKVELYLQSSRLSSLPDWEVMYKYVQIELDKIYVTRKTTEGIEVKFELRMK